MKTRADVRRQEFEKDMQREREKDEVIEYPQRGEGEVDRLQRVEGQ